MFIHRGRALTALLVLATVALVLATPFVVQAENIDGIEVVPGQKSQSGVSPPTNQRERDHVILKSKGGEGTPENGQVLCRECNLEKSNKTP